MTPPIAALFVEEKEGGKAHPSDDTPVALSFSAGGSSGLLWEMVKRGKIPRPRHFAVFHAETGIEHEWTNEYAAEIEEDCKREGVEFIRCSRGESLDAHLLSVANENRSRADHPPIWIAKDGGGRGQAMHRCTREFKVAPMRRAQAAWLARLGKPKRIVKWIGFGADEQSRATKSIGKQDVQWERLAFPLIRMGLKRGEQRATLAKWTGSAPRFSMCTICPWKSPERWLATPESQRDRVYEVDAAIRDMTACGLTDGAGYLSDRLVPVERLIRSGDPQTSLPYPADAGCDAGACFL